MVDKLGGEAGGRRRGVMCVDERMVKGGKAKRKREGLGQ
jgi:hypothetical protein